MKRDYNKLIQKAEETLSWGRDVSEMWTSTLYQKDIDLKIEQVEKSIEHEDIPKIRALVADLANFLADAERDYDGF